jgi:RNA recognition motif-containing protein
VGGDATAQAGGEDADIDEDEGPEDPVKEKKEVQRHDRMAQVKHEDSKPRQINPETEARTVFVVNLPSSNKKQMLKSKFSQAGKVESVRFRCASRPDLKTTKKVAEIKHKFHKERNNISSYVRMVRVEEAETACSINNTQVEGLERKES